MSKIISFYSWNYTIVFRSKLSFFELEKLLLNDSLNFKLLNLNKHFFFTFCNINNCFLLCLKIWNFSYLLKLLEISNISIIYFIIFNRFYYFSNFMLNFVLEKNNFLLKIIQQLNVVYFYFLYVIKKLIIFFILMLKNYYINIKRI